MIIKFLNQNENDVCPPWAEGSQPEADPPYFVNIIINVAENP